VARDQVVDLEEQLEALPPTAITETVNVPNPEVQRLEQEIGTMQQRLEQLLFRMTEEHPTIKELRRQIEARKERLTEVPATVVGSQKEGANPDYLQCKAQLATVRQHVNELESKKATLAIEMQTQRTRAQALRATRQEYTRLLREKRLYEGHYQKLFADLQAAKSRLEQVDPSSPDSKGEFGTEVTLLQRAVKPLRPSNARRFRLLLAGLAASAFLGFGLVTAAEFLDTSFRGYDQVAATLSIPVLGVLPTIETEEDRQRLQARRRTVRFAVLSAVVILGAIAVALLLAEHARPGLMKSIAGGAWGRLTDIFNAVANTVKGVAP